MPVSVMNWRQMRPTPELIAITMIDVGVATLSLNLKKVIQIFSPEHLHFQVWKTNWQISGYFGEMFMM